MSPAIEHQDIIINCPIRGDTIAASTNTKASRGMTEDGGRRGWQSIADDLRHSVVAALSLSTLQKLRQLLRFSFYFLNYTLIWTSLWPERYMSFSWFILDISIIKPESINQPESKSNLPQAKTEYKPRACSNQTKSTIILFKYALVFSGFIFLTLTASRQGPIANAEN